MLEKIVYFLMTGQRQTAKNLCLQALRMRNLKPDEQNTIRSILYNEFGIEY